MTKKLVLAGGGHAHMMTLANIHSFISSGHSVTVIQPSDFHYYSGMGPGLLSGYYNIDDIRFHTKHIVEKQGGTFINDKVVKIDPDGQHLTLETGDIVDYDVLSCNTGSVVPFSQIKGTRDAIFNAKPIERLSAAREKIVTLCNQGSLSIGIVGGGPAAVEIAGCAQHLAQQNGAQKLNVQLFAGHQLMKGFTSRVCKKIYTSFKKRNITINESGYVTSIANNHVCLEDNTQVKFDILFIATGVQPSSLFQDSKLSTGPKGGLRVNTHLQSIDYPNIFGGGDCIYFSNKPLNKVGVYAVRQNTTLLTNIAAHLENSATIPFYPEGGYMLIFNLGDGTGILQKGPFVVRGKLAFYLKNFIDRKFMLKFKTVSV